jgi:hypothetical protein
MDEFLKVIVPVAAALVGIFLGARLGRTTEHRQWLRNQKIEAYTSILRQINVSLRALDAYHLEAKTKSADDLKDITDSTNARLELIASRKVRTALQFLDVDRVRLQEAARSGKYSAERRKFSAALSELHSAMRDDMDVAERDTFWHRLRFYFYQGLIYPPQDAIRRWRLRRHSA